MSKTDQSKTSVLGIVFMLLTVFGMLFCVETLWVADCTAVQCALSGVLICALICALVYSVRDGKKAVAGFFHGFRWTYLAALALGIFCTLRVYLQGEVEPTVLFGFILCALSVLVLNLGKDLGKTISYALCVIDLLFSAIMPLFILISDHANKGLGDLTYGVPVELCVAFFILALVLMFATVTKYRDKAARGRAV